jgi:hypothetical protein
MLFKELKNFPYSPCIKKFFSKKLTYFLLILLLSSLFLIPLVGCSGSKAATPAFISLVEGTVEIKKSSAVDWVEAKVKDSLAENDVIRSGANSKAAITFFDGSVINLESNTQIEIKQLTSSKPTNIHLKQEIGETLSKVEKLVDSASRYEIETPVAVAGVRGSQMKVTVAQDGTTDVQNVEGKISVTAQGEEVLIPVGNTSTVKPGQAPSAPVLSTPISVNPDVHINTDSQNDLFDLTGNPVTGYQYLDIVNEWIERKGNNWAITINLAENYPENVDSGSLVEWDIMVDADNDINTGWKSAQLFNDLGIDYYISLSLTGNNFTAGAQRTVDSSTTYPQYVHYSSNGNLITIEFSPNTIGDSNKFSFLVMARYYSKIGDPQSLVAADKIPNSSHYLIYVPGS